MSFQSILSFYPTYAILDEVVSYGNYKNLNLYFDLKNNLQSLYMKDVILGIVDKTMISGYNDSSIFESIIHFLSFHKVYAAKRNININFFVFFESGHSNYHLNISKKYKIGRRVDDLYGLDREKRDLFFNVMQKNFMLLESAANKMPGIKVIRLQNLEADFVPYYLITRNLVDSSNNTGHVIYSNDHDMLQCLKDNVFIFSKSANKKKLVKKNEALSSYLKYDNLVYPDSFLTLVMSVIGDPGDDVEGIKGIGSKTVEKILNVLVKMVGGIDKLYDNVCHKRPIFQNLETYDLNTMNKHIKTIVDKEIKENFISNNLKLVDFEILSRVLDDPPNTEILDKKKHMLKILNDDTVVQYEIMKNALDKVRISFLDDDNPLSNIYYSSK